MRARSVQEWIHWLEIGAGAKWILRAALLLGIVVLSGYTAYKQFRGPQTETTLAQAVIARQVAAGEGFTTLVHYPQVVALLRARNIQHDVSRPTPDLYRAPLYPAMLAVALKVLPVGLRETLFTKIREGQDGVGADYVVLGANVLLLWIAAAQTFFLGRRLFDESVGMIATLGMLLSVAIWRETVALNGTPLIMVLGLGLFQVLAPIDASIERGDRVGWFGLTVAGAVCGLLFLTDYPAGVSVLVVMGWLCFRATGRTRLLGTALVLAGYCAVTAPWILRNIKQTGHPLALAGQGVALKAGDPTAEPAIVRTSFVVEGPAIDLNKLGNKGLTGVQRVVQDRLWSGGGLLLTAFFVCGFLYRFRNPHADRLRWLFVVMLTTLTIAQVFFDSGEGERVPVSYLSPLVMLFGAGFFSVLVASSDALSKHPRAVAVLLLAAQALPLARDLKAPRGLHFSYPPYYPALFQGLRGEVDRRAAARYSWMADVPEGAAWYSGRQVWAQPATLREFYLVSSDQPIFALVLTAKTLDRPFFSDLTKRPEAITSLGNWSDIYAGLVTQRFPGGFPLTAPQKVVDNLQVLIDPQAFTAQPPAGK